MFSKRLPGSHLLLPLRNLGQDAFDALEAGFHIRAHAYSSCPRRAALGPPGPRLFMAFVSLYRENGNPDAISAAASPSNGWLLLALDVV